MGGRHRAGGREPDPTPAQEAREDRLWDKYVETKQRLGPDDTTTFEAFFDWWEAT